MTKKTNSKKTNSKETTGAPDKTGPKPPFSGPIKLVLAAGDDMRARAPVIAYQAATQMVQRMGEADFLILDWATMALDTNDQQEQKAAEVYGQFVRAQPQAPAEALFLQGRKTGIHSMTREAWAELPPLVQAAHEIFAAVLQMLNRAIATIEETRRLEALEEQRRANPPKPAGPKRDKSIFKSTGKIGAKKAAWGKSPAKTPAGEQPE